MPILLILFIVVPLIELFVIIEVGQLIGVWPTIALLLLSAVLGSLLLRAQGRAVWRRFNDALAERRVPHREVFDGVLVIIGGTLLLTPGFVTDFFGLLLLIPPSRDAIRAIASKLLLGRVALGGRAAYWGYGRVRDRRARAAGGPQPGHQGANGASPPPRPGPTRPYDFEGHAQEIRDEGLLDPPREPDR
jgi:UPF0716 protein FxsA